MLTDLFCGLRQIHRFKNKVLQLASVRTCYVYQIPAVLEVKFFKHLALCRLSVLKIFTRNIMFVAVLPEFRRNY